MVDAIIRMESGGIVLLAVLGIAIGMITMWAAYMARRELAKLREQIPAAELAAAAAKREEEKAERELFRAVAKGRIPEKIRTRMVAEGEILASNILRVGLRAEVPGSGPVPLA